MNHTRNVGPIKKPLTMEELKRAIMELRAFPVIIIRASEDRTCYAILRELLTQIDFCRFEGARTSDMKIVLTRQQAVKITRELFMGFKFTRPNTEGLPNSLFGVPYEVEEKL